MAKGSKKTTTKKCRIKCSHMLAFCSIVLCAYLSYGYLERYQNSYTFIQVYREEEKFGHFPLIQLCPLVPINPVRLAEANMHFPLRYITNIIFEKTPYNLTQEQHFNAHRPLKELLHAAEWKLSDIVEELKIDGLTFTFHGDVTFPFKKTYEDYGLCFSLESLKFANLSADFIINFKESPNLAQLKSNKNVTDSVISAIRQEWEYIIHSIYVVFEPTSYQYFSYIINKALYPLIFIEALSQISDEIELEPYRVHLPHSETDDVGLSECHKLRRKEDMMKNRLSMKPENFNWTLEKFSNPDIYRTTDFTELSSLCLPKRKARFWHVYYKRNVRKANWSSLKLKLSSNELKIFQETKNYSLSKLLLDIGNMCGIVLGLNLLQISKLITAMHRMFRRDYFLGLFFRILKHNDTRKFINTGSIIIFLSMCLCVHSCILCLTFFSQSNQMAVSFNLETNRNICSRAHHFWRERSSLKFDIQPWLAAQSASYAFRCKPHTTSVELNCILSNFSSTISEISDFPACSRFAPPSRLHKILTSDTAEKIMSYPAWSVLEHCKTQIETNVLEIDEQEGCFIPDLKVYWEISGDVMLCYLFGLLGLYFGLSVLESVRNAKSHVLLKIIHMNYSPKSVCAKCYKSFIFFLTLTSGSYICLQIWVNMKYHPVFTNIIRFQNDLPSTSITVSACLLPQFQIVCTDDRFGNATGYTKTAKNESNDLEHCHLQNLIKSFHLDEYFSCADTLSKKQPSFTNTIRGTCITCKGELSFREEKLLQLATYTELKQVREFPKDYDAESVTFVVHEERNVPDWDDVIDVTYEPSAFNLVEVADVMMFAGYEYGIDLVNCKANCLHKNFNTLEWNESIKLSSTAEKLFILHEENSSEIAKIHNICQNECRYSSFTSLRGSFGIDADGPFWVKSAFKFFMDLREQPVQDVSLFNFALGSPVKKLLLEDGYPWEQLASDMAGLLTFVFGVSVFSSITDIVRWCTSKCKSRIRPWTQTQ